MPRMLQDNKSAFAKYIIPELTERVLLRGGRAGGMRA